MSQVSIPDLAALVEPLLGTAYSHYDCWDLVRELYQQGFGLDLARDTERAAVAFQEVWYRGNAADPRAVIEPWDLVIMDEHDLLPVSSHVGVALDSQQFVHARRSKTGVALERLLKWQPRLLQVARYRELL